MKRLFILLVVISLISALGLTQSKNTTLGKKFTFSIENKVDLHDTIELENDIIKSATLNGEPMLMLIP